MKKRKLKGFSLMEMLIVIALVVMMGALVAPFMVLNIKSGSLEGDVRSLVSAIREIQMRNKSSQNGKRYGIKLYLNKYNIFTGNDFASAEQNTDVNLSPENTISAMNLNGSATELMFDLNSIRPVNSGDFVITNTFSNYRININSEGLIEFEKI